MQSLHVVSRDAPSGGHSGHKLKLLEQRLQGNSNNADVPKALRFDEQLSQGMLEGVSQTQPVSPHIVEHLQESDDEGEGTGFGIVSLPTSRDAKRPKLEQPGSPMDMAPASLSPPPRSASKPITPLKEKNENRTPEPGRRSVQQRNTLQRYFPSMEKDPSMVSPLAQRNENSQSESHTRREKQWQAEREKLLSDLESYRGTLAALRREVSSKEEDWNSKVSEKTAMMEDLQRRLQLSKEAEAKREKQTREGLLVIATKAALAEQELMTARLHEEGRRLGALTTIVGGHLGLQEEWEDGPAFAMLRKKKHDLLQQRERIEAARKGMRKRLPLPDPPTPRGSNPKTATHRPQSAGCDHTDRISPEEYVAQDEILKAKLSSLKREEDALNKEEERLEHEKQRYLRAYRLLKEEEAGSYACSMLLNGRYVIQRLLGKGGFSEVYQAYDLEDMKEVAMKVHKLNSSWSDAKKSNYVKHATREFNIHKSLQHPRIVGFLDIFELDSNSFATVLELCAGGDLDTHLKEHLVLPEKEARVIMAQVFQGLAYLNEDGRRIIHYDLKPGNILFDSLGRVKITDFGLSKIAEQGNTQGLELTSQGAGTYWYLPPECFEISTRPPIISSKVDVWSAAVMHYQMLFGRRPFGEGLTQERILREDVMLNARKVAFPSKPTVSAECKDFISRCLTYMQQDRLNVLEAAKDPYLHLKRQRQSTNGS